MTVSENDRITFKGCLAVLSALLNSSALDPSLEAKDALASFHEYDWKMKGGCDPARFHQLKSILNGDAAGIGELDEFMQMVSIDGEHDLYFLICRGREIVAQLTPQDSTCSDESPEWCDMPEDSRDLRMRRLVANLSGEKITDLVEYRDKRESEGEFHADHLFGTLDWITGVDNPDRGNVYL